MGFVNLFSFVNIFSEVHYSFQPFFIISTLWERERFKVSTLFVNSLDSKFEGFSELSVRFLLKTAPKSCLRNA